MSKSIDRTTGHYHPQLEVMTPQARSEYLDRRLVEIVEHAYAKAPAVKAKFDQAKVSPQDIRTVKDLERLPITEKSRIGGTPEKESALWRSGGGWT